MTFIHWIIASLIVWIIGGILIGILTGRIIRGPGHHCPSPNHPPMRAHKQLTDDKPYNPGPPLTPHETAALDQLQEQLR